MTTTTLEEVWALFKETDRIIKENARAAEKRSQEFDNQLKENAPAAEKRSQEFDNQLKETDRIIKENALAAEKRSQELALQLKETERVLKQQSQELNKKLGKLGGRLGDFVVGLVKPAVVKLFQARGINVHQVYQNVEANNEELELATEIDLLVINGESCIVVEVKSNLSIDDVNEHLERMKKFKPLFPEYAQKQTFGAVAGMVIPDNVTKYAYRQGFFVIGQRGEIAEILNDSKFKPTIW